MSRDVAYLLALHVWLVCTRIRIQAFSQYRRPHVVQIYPEIKLYFRFAKAKRKERPNFSAIT